VYHRARTTPPVSVNKGGNSDFWTATVDLGASFR